MFVLTSLSTPIAGRGPDFRNDLELAYWGTLFGRGCRLHRPFRKLLYIVKQWRGVGWVEFKDGIPKPSPEFRNKRWNDRAWAITDPGDGCST